MEIGKIAAAPPLTVLGFPQTDEHRLPNFHRTSPTDGSFREKKHF
jgi:hypothetical protein